MTRRNSLSTIHEPFGDAYYYGPERMSARFEEDEKERAESGFADSTFQTILDKIDAAANEVSLASSRCQVQFFVSSMARSLPSSYLHFWYVRFQRTPIDMGCCILRLECDRWPSVFAAIDYLLSCIPEPFFSCLLLQMSRVLRQHNSRLRPWRTPR